MKTLLTFLNQSYLIFVAAICFSLTTCISNNPRKDKSAVQSQDTFAIAPFEGLITVDLTKKYPEKEFVVDDADKEFIFLETTDEVLADRDFKLQYVSDKRIVASNRGRGDIFFFGRDGKVISFVNRKGNSGTEYSDMVSIVFDEQNSEIFVVDYLTKQRCLVYSEDGKFLRQFYFPPNSWITDVYNFDEQTLLAYNGHRVGEHHAGDINQRMPYVFLSKKDGSVVSRLELSFEKRISDRHFIRVEGGAIPFTISSNNIVKNGQEFIIAERSSDTVYVLTQDKKLTPLLVRTPTVFNENTLITLSVDAKTERYLFLWSVSYNWDEIVEQWKKGQQLTLPPANKLVYDSHTGEVFNTVESIPRSVDSPERIGIDMYHADRLVERFEKGELKGKLKQIAQTIKDTKKDINPIVVITRYVF